jgi:hypothetical protein
MGVAASLATTLGTVTGTITTSASAVTSASSSAAGGFSLVSIHGTYAGVSFGITQSDDGGTTFYGVPIYDAAAMQWLAPGTTITPGTNAGKNYWVPISPATSEIKVLASAYTSGTGNIRIAGSYTAMPGSLMSQIMDAAGNARGANVDASNNLMVNINAASTAANVPTVVSPRTTGGLSMATGTIGATATAVKASAGQVYGWYIYNSNASVAYVQFYNSVTGSTTVGTSIVASIGIPAGGAANVFNDVGIAFSSAITIAITTTRSGTTSPTNTVDYNIYYN